MDLRVLNETEGTLRVVLSGTNAAFANALRRAMVSEVPVMAIDDVIFIENSSVLYDEVVAHRLGLVPLKTDLDAYVMPEECDCKSELGCSKCRASFTLEAEATEHSISVYSGDLKPESDLIRPVSDRIPITKLGPSQRLKLEAYARLGKGLEHAKWQPVSGSTYRYVPKVRVRPENLANPDEVVHWCPRDVFASDPTEKIIVKDEMACTLCEECVKHAQPIDPKKPFPIEIEGDETSFIFEIESTGALPSRRILLEAAKILDRKAAEFGKLAKAEVR